MHRKPQELPGGVDGGEGVERRELEKVLGKKIHAKWESHFGRERGGFSYPKAYASCASQQTQKKWKHTSTQDTLCSLASSWCYYACVKTYATVH